MNNTNINHNAIHWFRQASPYINAHRGKVFVVSFPGEALDEAIIAPLIHDIALLNHLGIRIVLVHGLRPQIDKRITAQKQAISFHNGRRITDDAALIAVKEAAGSVRVELEALLSSALPNTPMSGARIKVASGNYVVARPLGVIDGVDYCHTGLVRKIDTDAINFQLNHGHITLISSIGYSSTGEVFNLRAIDVATETAKALHAEKLIFLSHTDALKELVIARAREISPPDATQLLSHVNNSDAQELICKAVAACEHGVKRSHLINRDIDGALLSELFTRDGSGTMITGEHYEGLRKATINDVASLLELIQPFEDDGSLVRRSREQLELEIEKFTVVERDGMIIACAALYPLGDRMGELACVVTHPHYKGAGRADMILQRIEQDALKQGIDSLFVLTTRTAHWFRERGFTPAEIASLPQKKQRLYNFQRNSKVFIKRLH